jgi:hypothetical protein
MRAGSRAAGMISKGGNLRGHNHLRDVGLLRIQQMVAEFCCHIIGDGLLKRLIAAAKWCKIGEDNARVMAVPAPLVAPVSMMRPN